MDIISFNEASTANERIERFNANPDSDSGIVTVPKVIKAGETVTIPTGRTAILPNVQVDGEILVEGDGEIFVPSGSTGSEIDAALATKVDKVTSTDNAIVKFDGAAGQVQNTGLTIDDNNVLRDTNDTPITPTYGFKNHIINGGFDIWQRGESFTPNTAMYTADRWAATLGGGSTEGLVARVFGAIEKQKLGHPAIKIDMTTVGVSNAVISQKIEGLEKFSGKTLTLSFNLAGTSSGTISTFLNYGTNGSPTEVINLGGYSQTGTYDRKTFTFTVPDISGKTFGSDSYLYIYIRVNNTQIGNAYFGNIQLEEGSVATPFEQRPIGLELSLCQRYYNIVDFKSGGLTESSGQKIATGYYNEMRVFPSLAVADIAGNMNKISTYNLNGVRTDNVNYTTITGIAGSRNAFSIILNNSTASGIAGKIYLDAEIY